MSEKEVKRITKNGVAVYSYRNPGLHGFYISVFVKAGCMYEDEKYAGITHFLEHILIRNVNALYGMELYPLLDKRGLEFNASTYSEMVQFYVSGSSANFKLGAEILSKILCPVSLSAKDIDAERKRIKAEMRESDEKNSLAAFTSKTVFANTSLASSIVGNNKSLDRITGRRLEEYRKAVISRENTFFYVTGNFEDSDIDHLASLIESADISSGEKRENIAPVPEKFGNRELKVHVKKDDFYTEFGARVFEAIMDLQNSDGGYSSAVMGERFNPDEMGRLQNMIRKRTDLLSNGPDVFESSVNALKEIKEKELSADDWMADIARRQRQLKTQKGEK